MKEVIERLERESDELRVKVLDLEKFLNSEKVTGIDPIQRTLLKAQYGIMLAYSEVLYQRIDLLK